MSKKGARRNALPAADFVDGEAELVLKLILLPKVSLLTVTAAENGTLAIKCLLHPHIPSDNAPGAN